MMHTPAELRDFAERYTAAWCSGNASSVAACYSTNGSLKINADDPAQGREAITVAAQSFMTAFPDLQVLMDDIVVQADRPVFHWTLKGTYTGPGVTGQPVRISGFEVWRIGEDGLIAESEGHFDSAEYQRQLRGGAA
jgi:predicted ester cyclase